MKSQTRRVVFWLVAGVAVIGTFITIMVVNQDDSGGQVTVDDPLTNEEWVKGNAESTVELVEYSDFQCPACAAREPIVEDLLNEFGTHIKFVYRHFPLTSLHDNAIIAARASEAAGIQGKFWEMHDKLFENQALWSKQSDSQAIESFTTYAAEIGIDTAQFINDLDSKAVKSAVESDAKAAKKMNLSSTPSFVLDGTLITPKTYEDFRDEVREAIENAA